MYDLIAVYADESQKIVAQFTSLNKLKGYVNEVGLVKKGYSKRSVLKDAVDHTWSFSDIEIPVDPEF